MVVVADIVMVVVADIVIVMDMLMDTDIDVGVMMMALTMLIMLMDPIQKMMDTAQMSGKVMKKRTVTSYEPSNPTWLILVRKWKVDTDGKMFNIRKCYAACHVLQVTLLSNQCPCVSMVSG